MEMNPTVLRVGIVQMQALPLQVDDNLALAEGLVLQAAREGAQIVVLPEMFNVGFYWGEDLMPLAETLESGKTVSWLKSQAAQHRVYLTASLYERYDEHFYNTMVMVGPDGTLQHYRKRNPAISEVVVWRRSPHPGPGIFDTPLGRIGGAICFDAFTRETFEGFLKSKVDLVISVACWGIPRAAGRRPDLLLTRAILRANLHQAAEFVPWQYATRLGVPVVFVNQAGVTQTPSPVPPLYPWPLPQLVYDFHGNSHVRDSAGQVLVRASSTETAFCAVVPVNVPSRPARSDVVRVDLPPHYLRSNYYFVQPPRARFLHFLGRVVQAWGFRTLQKEYEARRLRHLE